MQIRINSEEEYLNAVKSLKILGYKVTNIEYWSHIGSLALNKKKNCWNPSSEEKGVSLGEFLRNAEHKNQQPVSLVFNPQSHYDNSSGSLFKIAEELGLNHWEFDIFKRLVRCRKKNQFEQDLQKIKDTVDIYLKELGNGV